MDSPTQDHPAVRIAMALLSDHSPALTATFQRDNVVAVVAENDQTRWHVLVEDVDGRWEAPTLVSGNGRPDATPRQSRTDSPPMLGEQHLTRSGRPGPDGGPPSASWCVLTGRAAEDAKIVTVNTGLDVQSCTVAADGFVSVLAWSPWTQQPEISVQTTAGTVITLFTG